MDEPTNGLDIPSKVLFRKLIESIKSTEKTFIISTHQVRDLDNMIDHVLIVKNGKMLLNKNIQEISKKITFQVQKEIPNKNKVIHFEKSFGGYLVMNENENTRDNQVNIEQLFNACITYPNRVQQIFKNI